MTIADKRLGRYCFGPTTTTMKDTQPVCPPTKIEKNIPIPALGESRSPFPPMEVGDSLFLPYACFAFTAEAPWLILLAQRWGRTQNPPIRFDHRELVEGGIRGTRVWRIT